MALDPRRVSIEQERPRVQRLVQPISAVRVQTTATAIYTAGEAYDFLIRNLWVANTTASAATLTLHMIPSGGSAGLANMWVNALPVSAHSTPLMLAHDAMLRPLLQPGMSLVALSNTADALNVGGWGQDFFGGEV